MKTADLGLGVSQHSREIQDVNTGRRNRRGDGRYLIQPIPSNPLVARAEDVVTRCVLEKFVHSTRRQSV